MAACHSHDDNNEEDDDDEEFGDFTAVKRDSMEIPPAPASGTVEISQEEDRESYLSRVSAFDPSFCGDDDDDADDAATDADVRVHEDDRDGNVRR